MVTSVPTTNPLCLIGDQQQKTPGRTVIAHISDLHFTSATNPASEDVWGALRTDLPQHKIDLLVATGDLVDSSIIDNYGETGVKQAFAKVKEFLLSLCEASGVADPSKALRVVPGNHDFRIKGIFKPESRIPLVKTFKQWFLTPHYDLFNEALGEYFKPVYFPNLRCCLFTFDSNAVESGLVLATGRVDNNKIVEFTSLHDAMQNTHRDRWAQCTKIALLHHHPMPIGPTEREASRVEDESYVLMKNAGLFMSEMVRRKVDLILHGHKHYPALSRATVPRGTEEAQTNGDLHTISVVAAGSASRWGHPHTSYNLVTIHNNGTIAVERRVREEISYRRGPSLPSIQSYEDTRRLRFMRLAQKLRIGDETGVRIRAEKYTRVDTIKPGSGDDVMCGHLEDVTAADPSRPPTRIPSRFSSRSGRPAKPKLDSKTHSLDWNPDTEQPGKGFIVFDRPVEAVPMSFTYRVTISNAIHSNAQDRLAVTGTDDKESVYATINEWYDMFTLKVRFPDTFDRRPRVEVLDETQRARDYVEERYAARRFTSFDDDNTAVLIVDRPLPGYTYKIVWELPKTEAEERQLSAVDRNRIEEIRERLLALRTEAGSEAAARVRESLVGLKTYINALPIGAEDMELVVHVHDPAKGGLVCVAALSSPEAEGELFGRVIRVGDTAIGQAYRRREHVDWVRGENQGDDLATFLDYDQARPHTGILSVPLFHPLNEGGKVAVTTLATRLRIAPILSVLEDGRSEESEAAFKVLVTKTHSWYARELMLALGLPAVAEPTRQATAGDQVGNDTVWNDGGGE
jgi:3',5'-cyclic AMP phosphodiesterase CpdA